MVVFKQNGLLEAMGVKRLGLFLMVAAGVAMVFFTVAYFIGRPPASEQKPAAQNSQAASRENLETAAPSEEEGAAGDQASEPVDESASSTEETATTTPAEEPEPAAGGDSGVVATPAPAVTPPVKKTPVALPKTTSVSSTPAKPAVPVDPKLASGRDEKRQSDMRRISAAQRLWYTDHKKYYASRGVPSSIGSSGLNIADPINAGSVCGRDYVYCGLNNILNTAKFCYYAKLETGGYYIVSEIGNAENATAPLSLDQCSALAVAASKPKIVEEVLPTTAKERDAVRKAALAQLIVAQNLWFSLKGKYYTCSAIGGDCLGKAHNYPATLGFAMTKTPVDPFNTGLTCGRDYIYCGLDNTSNSAKFCYYTKLEGGGYYTATNGGNFERGAAPATFAECAQMN